MKRFMMKRMMPMMGNLTMEEKMQIMKKMMPEMMKDMSMKDRMEMMRTMMPEMMKNVKKEEMGEMMDAMMPVMMERMEEKGIRMTEMMQMMCPKCISVATAKATGEEKEELKSKMQGYFSRI